MKFVKLPAILAACAALVSCAKTGNRNIIDTEIKSGAGKYCSLSFSNGILEVCYTRGGDNRVMLARSTNLAKTWKITNVVYSTNVSASGDPVVFARSTNGCAMAFKGSNKTVDILLPANEGTGWDYVRSGATDCSRNFALWREGNRMVVCYTKTKLNNDLFSVSSADGGSNWKSRTVDNTAQSQGGKNLSMLSPAPGMLVTVYNGAYHGKGKGKSLKAAYSFDYGASWKRVVEIDGPECSVGNNESMACDGSDILIVYSTGKGMKYALSSVQEGKWSTGFITNTNGQSFAPGYSLSLAYHGGKGYFSYYDAKNISIYSFVITNGGLSVVRTQTVEKIPFYIEGLKTSIAEIPNGAFLVYYHPQEKCLKYFSMKSGN